MVKAAVAFFRQRPGLFILLLLLSLIWAVSLKPQFYLIGWDNFSSYFNLPTNIFRTFFATWRAYRGLGVASDSESTDLFRQLFYLVLSPVTSESMLDQIYVLTACAVGVLAMYALAYNIIGYYFKKFSQDIGGFFAALFYLCNLNTLATFYFPMIMYINRFFSLPLLFLIFFVFLKKQKVSYKEYFFACISIFFISGSYITATIFITVVIALFCFGIFQENKKRFLLIFSFYLLLNSFWLFPFGNYTIQKANIIRLAPNFIEANEIQLNKGKGAFVIDKQLVLYNSFFDTSFTDVTGKNILYFHPITAFYKQSLYKYLLFLLPLFYFLGFFSIFRNVRKNKEILWIPFVFFLFLFLTLKEFSPFGFIYAFLNNISPYFGVLFRFGDTKFHIFLAFTGSISAGIGILYFCQVISFVNRKLILFLVVCGVLFTFRFYVTEGTIGYFIYNKLPYSYVDMANIINKDQGMFRVLHLPMDNNAYWKSYEWGAFGSSFLHFMIDKPFIDKTFEPASMENAYLHKQIGLLLSNIQLLHSQTEGERRARDFATLLNKTGVKYLIFDDSVKKAIYSRGIALWGNFNNEDVKVMMQHLVRIGLAQKVKEYDVDSKLYGKAYESLHALTDEQRDILANNNNSKIYLYVLRDYQQKIEFLPKVTYVDNKLDNLLETNVGVSKDHWIQDKAVNGKLFPFVRRNVDIKDQKDTLSFNIAELSPNLGIEKLHLTAAIGDQAKDAVMHYVSVYQRQEKNQIVITFYLVASPDFNGQTLRKLYAFTVPLKNISLHSNRLTELSNYVSDWSVLPQKQIGNYRLRVGNYVIPLPANDLENDIYVGTVALQGNSVPIDFLTLKKDSLIDLDRYTLPQNPNCFEDKLQGSFYKIEKQPFKLISQNQSTCLFYDLQKTLIPNVSFVEAELNIVGKSQNLDDRFGATFSQNTKPMLTELVKGLPKQNLLRLCAKEPFIDTCYNLHQLINVTGNTHVIVPFEKPLLGDTVIQLLLSLKNSGYQNQEISIQDLTLYQFSSVLQATLVVPEEELDTTIFTTDKTLQFNLPKVLSPYSFFFNSQKEGMYGYNIPCGKNGYQTVRSIDGKLLSYIDNCFIEFFQEMPFSSSNFSLWTLSYNLASGKFPFISVKDKIHLYGKEYVSLYQGYPDIFGFKLFQSPEQWLNKLLTKNSLAHIQEQINSLPLQTAYGYSNPSVYQFDTGVKQLTIHQDAENEGLILIKDFSIQPLPTNWFNLSISGENQEKTFQMPKTYNFKQILPSLYKTTVEFPKKGEYMLLFNEGFDKQWKLYSSILGVVGGLFGGESPKRCDGYANCFVVNQTNDSSAQTYYIFYTPERLTIVGWFVTLFSVVFFAYIFIRRGVKKEVSLEPETLTS